MKRRRGASRVVCLLLVLGLAACAGGAKSGAEGAALPKRFPMPEIPAMLTDPAQRANYAATHFWDRFDFTDTLYVDLPDVTEQGFADYINILNGPTTPEVAAASLRKLVQSASADTAMFRYVTGLLEKYLYDPNSPMRNEELYIPVLQALVASPQLDSLGKLRPRDRLATALKNRSGARATDFPYTDLRGRSGRLADLRADYTVLFFNNPGCPACREIREQMMASPVIAQRIATGSLRVLAVYPDADLEAWREHGAEFPDEWLYVHDKGQVIAKEKRYDLKAIPTLYLLGGDKRVLLKDVTFPQLEAYLAEEP